MYLIQDEWGITPLMAACYNGYVNTAEVLVENGALVDLPNKVIYGSMIYDIDARSLDVFPYRWVSHHFT